MSFASYPVSSSTLLSSAVASQGHTPNFPLKEPVFFVPRVPEVEPVADLPPPRRPPAPGYDMKTLRRQVDFLTQEIEERAKCAEQFSSQNSQLWRYIQDLLEANKFNANTMREHVSALNAELSLAHRERLQLAERLSLALSSQKMLDDLAKDLQGTHQDNIELERRRREAENALRESQRERAQLEDSLKERVSLFAERESELDRFRALQREGESIEKAELFFASSSAVLKSAYERFKAGVKRRMRENRIESALKNVFRHILRRQSFDCWMAFMDRKHVMRKNQRKRAHSALTLSFARWKLLHSLSRLTQNAQRHRLLTRTLSLWKDFLREARTEREYHTRTENWKRFCEKRKVFNGWRAATVFLGWDYAITHDKERLANAHFLKSLWRAWRLVAHRERRSLWERESAVWAVCERMHLSVWRALCLRRWRRRGQLLRRFFRSISHSLALRNAACVCDTRAVRARVTYTLRKALALWRKRASKARARRAVLPLTRTHNALAQTHTQRESKRALTTQLPHTTHTPSLAHTQVSRRPSHTQNGLAPNTHNTLSLSVYHARLLKNAFLQCVYRLSVRRRERVCERVAMQRYLTHLAHRGLSLWRDTLTQRAAHRARWRRHTLTRTVTRWLSRTRSHILTRHALTRGCTVAQRSLTTRLRHTLRLWLSHTRRARRLRRSGTFLARLGTFRAQQRTFSVWQRQWTRALFWRSRSLSVDYERVKALHALHVQSLEERERERCALREERDALEETLLSLQETLAERENVFQRERARLCDCETQRTQLLTEVTALREALSAAEAERERYVAWGTVLCEERDTLARERERRAEEVRAHVALLQREAQDLENVLRAEERSLCEALNEAEAETKKCEKECEIVFNERQQTQARLTETESERMRLEREQEVLCEEVEKLQKRVRETARESEEVRSENERLLRERESEVRVLRSDAGVAQARVNALYEVLHDVERERSRMDIEELDERTHQELSELRAMKNKFEDSMRTFRERAALFSSQERDRDGFSRLLPLPATPTSDVSSALSPSELNSSVEKERQRARETEKDYLDARETIRMLSQKLRSTLASPAPVGNI